MNVAMIRSTLRKSILFLTLLVLLALSNLICQTSMASETKLTIRLDEMKGWPGGSNFGIWDNGHLELRFNLTMNNFTSGTLNLHLYVRAQGYGWAYLENLQLNGYYLEKHWAFAGSYYGVEKDDWVELEILPEYVTMGENHLLVDLYLSYHDSDEREDFVVYGSSYLELQKVQDDTDTDSKPNGLKFPNVSLISILIFVLVVSTGFIFIITPHKRMEIVIAIVIELLIGLILHFLLT